MHDPHIYYVVYYFIGLSYWAINIFVRKLHTKNDEGEGWFLAPMWMFLWPMCFIALLIVWISNLKERQNLKIKYNKL
jgi:hypothetical protein